MPTSKGVHAVLLEFIATNPMFKGFYQSQGERM